MGVRSRNFDGLPVLAGMIMVSLNMIIHIVIFQMILQILDIGWFEYLVNEEIWGRLLYLSIFIAAYWYYAYKGRYKRIIERYNSEKDTYWKRHPFVTIWLYTMISFIIFILFICIKKDIFFIVS